MARDKKPSKRTQAEMRRGTQMNFVHSQEELRDGRRGPVWDAWRARDQYMSEHLRAGRLEIVPEYVNGFGLPTVNPTCVTVRVGTCTFTDEVDSYPSQKMVANVALALQAGMGSDTTGPNGTTGPTGSGGE